MAYGLPLDDPAQIRYEKWRSLGTGSYGVAWLCTDTVRGTACVVKQLRLGRRKRLSLEKDAQRTRREVDCMKLLDHVNVVSLHDWWMSDQHLHIVMEYADGGDLGDRIRTHHRDRTSFSRGEVGSFAEQLLTAVVYLHERGVLHRDIKPDNCFLTAANVLKLGDFGLSRAADLARTSCGTPYYMAPEVGRVRTHRSYTNKCDVWSVGVVLYELIFLNWPYLPVRGEVGAASFRRPPHWPVHRSGMYPAVLTRVARAALTFDPRERPSAAALLQLVAKPRQRRSASSAPAPGRGDCHVVFTPLSQQAPVKQLHGLDSVLLPPPALRPPPAPRVPASSSFSVLRSCAGCGASAFRPVSPTQRRSAPAPADGPVHGRVPKPLLQHVRARCASPPRLPRPPPVPVQRGRADGAAQRPRDGSPAAGRRTATGVAEEGRRGAWTTPRRVLADSTEDQRGASTTPRRRSSTPQRRADAAPQQLLEGAHRASAPQRPPAGSAEGRRGELTTPKRRASAPQRRADAAPQRLSEGMHRASAPQRPPREADTAEGRRRASAPQRPPQWPHAEGRRAPVRRADTAPRPVLRASSSHVHAGAARRRRRRAALRRQSRGRPLHLKPLS
eukprot:TRINITY_DN5815_c0_g1_i2.p1 TRINITY_DN5815_c0_g1~~TRINITY_DN5815_c0_g1_i2.p1  ORF type:complete len:636 (+),score=196.37 TRINITY_DN5815_c0_g1_i2:69-1910(+)